MRPIRLGDRGPAVEDVQRRLRILGYDLGPTGIDGVFFGRTAEAVRVFQQEHHLGEDSLVGDETWSALVDATFAIGDRMLYLRLPHFHGSDVRVLQNALNALGFTCGDVDAIFGAYTERALAEFQRNTGLVADGIAGNETIRALLGLRHVWEGKDSRSHSAAQVAPGRARDVLARVPFAVRGLDAAGVRVAERVINLARATSDQARCFALDSDDADVSEVRFVLEICGFGTASAVVGRPVVRLEGDESFEPRMLTALESARGAGARLVVELMLNAQDDEHEQQRAAVRLLDALCVAFDR